MNLGYSGYFRLEKRTLLGVDSAGKAEYSDPVEVMPWTKNLITDSGLDLLGQTTGDLLTYARLGTGSTAPATTDSTLVAQVAATATSAVAAAYGVETTAKYVWRRVTKRFAAGSASGVNLAELAMSNTASGPVFSRCLIKDTGGSPTTITLAPVEVLDVIYELRIYIHTDDAVSTATIDGVSTTVTIRTHGFANWATTNMPAASVGYGITPNGGGGWNGNGVIGAAENQPTAGDIPPFVHDGATPTVAAYVNGSFQHTYTWNLGLAESNFPTGVGSLSLGRVPSWSPGYDGWWGAWTWGFSPKINKTASRTATITVGISWGRYTP